MLMIWYTSQLLFYGCIISHIVFKYKRENPKPLGKSKKFKEFFDFLQKGMYNEEKTKGGSLPMIIQSKKIWIADQFIPAQVEIEGGKIVSVGAYGAKLADEDYGDKRIIPGMIDVRFRGCYRLPGYHHYPE